MKALRRLASSEQARRLVEILFSRGLSTLSSFLLLYVASRVLTLPDYGLYVFLFSAGSALGLFIGLGRPMLLIKHLRGGDTCTSAHNRALLRASLLWVGGAGAAILAFGGVLYMTAPELPSPYNALYLTAGFAAIYAVSELLQAYFRVRENFWLALVPRENLWRPLAAAVLVAGVVLGISWSGRTAFVAVSLALLVSIAVQVVVFLRQSSGVWTLSRATELRGRLRAWRREGAFFWAHTGFAAAAAYLETVLIGVVIGLEAAAFFFLVTRLTMLLNLPSVAVETFGMPRLSEKLRRNDRAGAQQLAVTYSFVTFTLALLGSVVLLAIAPYVLVLFDPSFSGNFDVLAVMAASVVAHAFFGVGTGMLLLAGGERYYLIFRTLLFVPYVGCLVVSGQLFGLIGVAVTSLAFVLIENVIALEWCVRKRGIDLRASTFVTRRFRVSRSAGPPR
ncbi:lipopolysaccharide biosynthesis protein [Stappia stellulata]|uniref:lipopolysaccharide biosynthesis protein n=1 Tax=Stappia stellulata TaxID=71235 RepID=UPI000684AF6F|nr:lipopolysaccharide biosynthesis protein [Stappia stellulata]